MKSKMLEWNTQVIWLELVVIMILALWLSEAKDNGTSYTFVSRTSTCRHRKDKTDAPYYCKGGSGKVCEQRCSNWTACVGYSVLRAQDKCILYPSLATPCPEGWSGEKYPGPVAQTVLDLVDGGSSGYCKSKQGSKFEITELGGLCSDIGKKNIDNLAECEDAAVHFGGYVHKNVKWDSRPKGCSFQPTLELFWWNSHETGSRHRSNMAICTRRGLKNKWECDSCRDPERSSDSHRNRTWGHLGDFGCDKCKATCEEMDNCDGIQCVEFEKARSVSKANLARIPVGLPCQWLRKPKKPHACIHNDKFNTCWRNENDEDDDGNCDCLCKCCKNQGIPNKCVYQPIESVGTNKTHEKLMIVEPHECANYTKELAACRSQCVSVDCLLSEWGTWSSFNCTNQDQLCGKCVKRRAKEIVRDCQYGGKCDCKREEKKEVHLIECKNDCEMAPWGNWTMWSCRKRNGELSLEEESYRWRVQPVSKNCSISYETRIDDEGLDCSCKEQVEEESKNMGSCGPSYIEMEETDLKVMEENKTIKVPVIRKGNLDIVSKVNYSTLEMIKSNGSKDYFATENVDFSQHAGALEFGVGEANKEIAVGIYTDALLEENETFKIILTNESENAIIGSKNETVITIIDDDNETIWEHQYKMPCWKGMCIRKDKEDHTSLILNNVTDHRGDKMTIKRCVELCNAFKNVEESKNPNVTVTGCQYKRGGLCGYFTEPIDDPGVNARVGVALTREIPSAASLEDPDQCCAFRQGCEHENNWDDLANVTLSASSEFSSSYKVDNLKSEGGKPWHSKPEHEYQSITFKFDSDVLLAGFRSKAPVSWDEGHFKDFSFEYSTDGGSTWDLVYEGRGSNLDCCDWETIIFGNESTPASTFRLSMLNDHGYGYIVINQLELLHCDSSS